MKLGCIFVAIAVAALISGDAVHAQTVAAPRGQVLLDISRQKLVINKDGKTSEQDLRRREEIGVEPRRTVRLGIYRHMPLIFTYTLDGITLTETADWQAASQFAKSLQDLLAIAPFKSGPASAFFPAVERPRVDQKVNELKKILQGVGFNDQMIQDVVTLRNTLKKNVGDIQDLTLRTLDGDTELRAVKKEVTGWSIAAKAKDVDRLFKIVADARNELFKGLQGDPDFLSGDPGLAETVTLLAAEEEQIRSWLKIARDFGAAVAKTGSDLLFEKEVAYDATHLATAAITVKFVDGAKDLAKAKLTEVDVDKLEGAYTVVFEPMNPIVLGVGLSAVFVFAKDIDGEFIGFRPTGMLTIGPRSWQGYIGAPHLEVGVTPETDKIGLYFGVGFRVRGAFGLSAGYTAQQRKIAETSDFRSSAYFGGTLDLVPKK